MKKRILIGTLGVLVLAALAIGAPTWRLVGPTNGRPIDGNANGTALLVVDVQEHFTGARAKKPFHEAARLIATVNRLIHASSERGDRCGFHETDAW